MELRDDLKARRFTPELVREAMIPERGGKYRRLGMCGPGSHGHARQLRCWWDSSQAIRSQAGDPAAAKRDPNP